MSLVRPAYGPSLPQLLGARRWRLVRAISVVIAVAAVAVAITARASSSDLRVVSAGEPSFNYAFEAPLRRVGAHDVEERRGAVFVQSMTVRSLRLPPYRGDSGGTLPVLVDRLEVRLAAEHADFVAIDQGRARINDSPGYYIAWEARRDGRRLFGRDYLLVPEDEKSPRRAARLELLSTYAGGVSGADDVGRVGKLKQPLRSFRFGTEAP